MRRREFIAFIGSSLAAWPLAARAQQANKLPTIGLLATGSVSGWQDWTAALVQRLRELGWTDGRTVTIEYRWADGRSERSTEIAREFVRLKVDVIVTSGTGAGAAQQVTSTIPIVFALSADPLGAGLVKSLARPGGNVTGLSLQSSDTAGKRMELLRDVLPNLRRLAIIGSTQSAATAQEIVEARRAAGNLGLEADVPELRHAEDIAPAFARLGSVQALYVCASPLINANYVRINTLAIGARLPTIHSARNFLVGGGFMSYGANNSDLFRRAGGFVDKILRGAKPGDLPVEQPTKFELVINLTAAKALGIKIPEAFLLRAEELIE